MGEMPDLPEENQFQSSENSLVDRMQTTSLSSRLTRQVSAAVTSSRCMKAVLMIVVVCVVFFCGFAMGRWNPGGTNSALSGALQNTTPSTPEHTPTGPTTPEGTELHTQATTLPQDPFTLAPPQGTTTPQQSHNMEWERNKNLLVSLGCRPRLTPVQVPHNTSHGNQTLLPTHLVVERCLKNSSFCGQSMYGEANGEFAGERCVPAHKEVENFQVMYLSKGLPVKVFVPMEVHKSCTCDNGAAGTLND